MLKKITSLFKARVFKKDKSSRYDCYVLNLRPNKNDLSEISELVDVLGCTDLTVDLSSGGSVVYLFPDRLILTSSKSIRTQIYRTIAGSRPNGSVKVYTTDNFAFFAEKIMELC